jgi:hypothetical protein
MYRVVVLSLVFLAPACASSPGSQRESLRQAAARPAPAPAGGIVQLPPSYPGATYTPPGTGLPGERVPGPQRGEVPRSPNKRVLPATKEPGLWAADGAPRASSPPQLFDVELPYPDGADTPEEQATTDVCASTLTRAARSADELYYAVNLPEPVRRCFAARAYEHCAGSLWATMARDRERGHPYDPEVLEQLRVTHAHASRLVAQYCAGVSWSRTDGDALSAVNRQWMQDQGNRMKR